MLNLLIAEFACDSSRLRTAYSSIKPSLIDSTHISFSADCELSRSEEVTDTIYCDEDTWSASNEDSSDCVDILGMLVTYPTNNFFP